MICPHCKKPIQYEVTPAAMKRAKELRKLGYSFRDIERVLLTEGHQASYSTIARKLTKPQDRG